MKKKPVKGDKRLVEGSHSKTNVKHAKEKRSDKGKQPAHETPCKEAEVHVIPDTTTGGKKQKNRKELVTISTEKKSKTPAGKDSDTCVKKRRLRKVNDTDKRASVVVIPDSIERADEPVVEGLGRTLGNR